MNVFHFFDLSLNPAMGYDNKIRLERQKYITLKTTNHIAEFTTDILNPSSLPQTINPLIHELRTKTYFSSLIEDFLVEIKRTINP